MNQKFNVFLLIAIVGLLSACKMDAPKITVKSKALGVMNEIVMVSDADVWASVIGDTTKQLFEGYYPLTHRPEPTFDLRHFTVQELNEQPLRKDLRTYMLLANLNDMNSAATKMVQADLGEEKFNKALTDPNFNTSVGRDKWANGQIVIYVFANGIDALASAIVKNFDGISSRVNEHDAIQLSATTYARGKNMGVAKQIQATYEAEVIIPTDFTVVLEKPEEHNMYWFKKETKHGAMNIVLRQYDYTGPEMLDPKEIKRHFDTFGINVSSDQPETYIAINDRDLPILQYDRTISGHYTKEYRGIWEMENDFIGGSYQCYAIVNKAKMITLEGFVFAPGQRKRDMMQQIDLIAKQIKW